MKTKNTLIFCFLAKGLDKLLLKTLRSIELNLNQPKESMIS